VITPDSTLLSTPRCTEQTALYYLMGRGSWYAPEARAEIVAAYWSVCASVGLDPLLALAQCIHETSASRLIASGGRCPAGGHSAHAGIRLGLV
jgi:hypothetical protein